MTKEQLVDALERDLFQSRASAPPPIWRAVIVSRTPRFRFDVMSRPVSFARALAAIDLYPDTADARLFAPELTDAEAARTFPEWRP